MALGAKRKNARTTKAERKLHMHAAMIAMWHPQMAAMAPDALALLREVLDFAGKADSGEWWALRVKINTFLRSARS